MTTPNAPLVPTPQLTSDIHQVDDVDTSVLAHHHTLGYGPNQAAPGGHRHDGSDSSSVLTDYAPVVHTHTEGQISSLISDLGGKAATIHTHTEGQVTDLTADIADLQDQIDALSGGSSAPVYVQDSAPVGPPSKYVWFQTNMGAGEDFTIWIEDGDA